MKTSFILVLCMALAGWAFAQQPIGNRPVDEPCFTDPLSVALHRAYPDGVPLRNLPAPIKVEKVDADLIYYIPVVVHIMHFYGSEMNVTPEQVISQIDILNEGYGRYGSGANTNPVGVRTHFRFCLAQIDPDGNATPGYEYIGSEYAVELDPLTDDTLMKRTTIWDPKRYMNIWTVRAIKGSYEGYAYLPSEVAGTVWDGIIVRHTSFGSFPYGTSTTYGNTIVHEAGHYLGLYHPWGLEEGVCSDAGTDYCDDTPPVPAIYYSHTPSCNAPTACDGNLRQVANYMDYADDLCQNLFTVDQGNRMLQNLLTYRSAMVAGNNLSLVGCASIADTLAASDSIYVYPVPATAYLNITVDFKEVGATRVELIDVTGRSVYKALSAQQGRGTIAIDVSSFPQGIYTLRITNSRADMQKRVRLGY